MPVPGSSKPRSQGARSVNILCHIGGECPLGRSASSRKEVAAHVKREVTTIQRMEKLYSELDGKQEVGVLFPEKRGGLNGWMQRWLEVY